MFSVNVEDFKLPCFENWKKNYYSVQQSIGPFISTCEICNSDGEDWLCVKIRASEYDTDGIYYSEVFLNKKTTQKQLKEIYEIEVDKMYIGWRKFISSALTRRSEVKNF